MKPEKKMTVLIVDDQEINRTILRTILQKDYDTKEAGNGKEALEILEKDKDGIQAILLDLVMPLMDGYTFLKAIRDTPMNQIPIIVITGETSAEFEEQALKAGAWDFISKPYQPTILLGRLKNAIARSQMGLFEHMKHLAEHDLLTDLYNRDMFYRATREMIDRNPGTKFSMIRFDIDSFNLVNSFWGEKEGDKLLKFITGLIRKAMDAQPVCTYGRINSDIFCFCMPSDEKNITGIIEDIKRQLSSYNDSFYVKPSFGIYEITKPQYSIEAMYDRATIAAQKCKGKYNLYVGTYDNGIHDQRVREREIENEMQKALEEEQFKVYLQPKYSLKTDLPSGAEALVRWDHPQWGMVSPGVFIPVFERNGFISELDYYMWDHVCALIRKWLDEGLDPAPVSVNISRVNMYNPHIVRKIASLTKKHGIPNSLLNLELTESAYMDNPDAMKEIVRSLQAEGFKVMMDDFGSGYSSLNTLKDITVDVLKVDMKFLKGGDEEGRSERILASIIRMAGWLSLPVIVEGVETREQTEFLRSIGCGFVQGFYFARPMPVAKYEQLIRSIGKVSEEETQMTNEKMNEMIWTNNENVELFFDSLRHPAAIFEADSRTLSPLRVNRCYNEAFGYGNNIFTGNGSLLEECPEPFRKMFDSGRGQDKNVMAEMKVTDVDGRERTLCVVSEEIGYVSGGFIYFVQFMDCCPDTLSSRMEERAITNSITNSEFDYIALISMDSKTLTIHDKKKHLPVPVPENGTSYDESVQKFLRQYAIPNETEECLQIMSFKNIVRNLAKCPSFTCCVSMHSGDDSGVIYRKQFKYSYLNHEKSSIIFTRRDISDLFEKEHEHAQQMEVALAAAKQANRAKSDFLSRMSHEIRTPMNAIIGMDALAAQALGNNDRVADCLSKIGISARYLLALINDILDMSRIESGKMLLNNEKFVLSELISGVNAMIYNQAKAKGLEYECLVSNDAEEAYIGDAMRLQQILINVLGNSVKFTSKGKISLEVRTEVSADGKRKELQFVVNDTGCGIREENYEKIFEPFVQGVPNYTTVYGGSGLGLAITKSLTDLMGGSIKVRSIVDVGTEFTISVPLKPAAVKADLSLVDLHFEKMKVMVVDDDIFVCEQTSEILKDLGISGEWVTSGIEAVHRVREKSENGIYYDFIFIDWKMPDMDGLETTRQIRRLVGPDVTIIIISAYDWEAIEVEARAAGANLLITKPIFRSTLISAFEKTLRHNEDAEEKQVEYDFTGRRVLVAEDNQINAEITRNLLENKKCKVELAGNGVRAMEMFVQNPVGYYDAILMDIQMPVMDGLQATINIRHWSRCDAKKIPIIAMTANAFDEDIEKSRAAGMNAHLSKPIEPDLLYHTLCRILLDPQD